MLAVNHPGGRGESAPPQPQILEAIAELAHIVNRQKETQPRQQSLLCKAGKPCQSLTSLCIRFEEFTSARCHVKAVVN